jgi:anti-sigma factor RsiW
MCEFSGKLIAWLDDELSPVEAADVERHLEACPTCRVEIDVYKRVSGELNDYCDESIAPIANRGVIPWAPAITAVVASATLVVLFLAVPVPRIHVEHPNLPLPQMAAEAMPAADAKASPAPVHLARRDHRGRGVTPVQNRDVISTPEQNQSADLLTGERTVQIAIPAEEMFPPGAVPKGMNFVADVTIAADGSAERISLRPRLAGYERGITQP